ncbi:hypothetical protein FSP39_014212 [Pinctada imbricata]|uniref:Uncharacterized protein n=1 Tax=Pinctada imbricata TaxID=66713 RepID=A0AA88Y122_PINIB|nr:hypothetical protein FSP39_014212 [Pinctada imbricata]
MDYVIRRLRTAAMKGFMKIEAHPRLDRDEWVRTSLSGWYHEHSSQFMAALRCSTLQQLRDEQSNILQDFLSGYYEKEQSGAVLHLTRDMITRVLKEHGGDTANTDYVFFPMDKVTAKILHFSREVMNRTRKYEESLYDDLSNAAKKLLHLLEPGQKTVLYEILRHLESSESKVTTPGPTKSVVPLGLYRHVKEDIKILEKLKYVLDLEGKLTPHIKELIMNRIKEKTALLATLKTTHL